MGISFEKRNSVYEVEEGFKLQPKFDENGLIPVITVNDHDKEILMHSFMNKEAFKLSIETKKAHYWSRSRKSVWKKGETSGLSQNIKRIKIDDDQDCVIFFVKLGGLQASCHVGYKSCFYRELSLNKNKIELVFTEAKKVFDPKKVYGNTPNPTKL